MVPSREIKIGRNGFIGGNSIILKGTVLGDGCVVGAGAVVCGKFEDVYHYHRLRWYSGYCGR